MGETRRIRKRDVLRLYGVKRREIWALGVIERGGKGLRGWVARRIRDRIVAEDGGSAHG